MPRRHTAFVRHLANHLGPTDNFFIVVHAKGSDLAGPMTLNAAILQYPADLIGVRYVAGIFGVHDATDDTADRVCLTDCGSSLIADCGQRVRQKILLRSGTLLAIGILVIDGTAIAELAVFVEEEDLWRSGCSKNIGDFVPRVF